MKANHSENRMICSLATSRLTGVNEQKQLRLCFQRLSGRELDALGQIYDLTASDIYGLALWRTKSKEDAADLFRRKQRLRVVSLEECNLLEAPATHPETNVDAACASQALGQLPEQQREALYLKQFCDLSFAEIAAIHADKEIRGFTQQ